MKEIKFRAKIICEDISITLYKVEEIDFKRKRVILEDSARDFYRFDEVDLLQYLDVKDKNGKEAYEEDIIKSERYPFYGDKGFTELNYLGVLGLDVDGCYYDLKPINKRVAGRACGGNISELNSFEIVGNLTENPELLQPTQGKERG